MTRFLSILANQRPAPIGLDETGRVQFSCNFRAQAEAGANWMGALVKILTDLSLGVLGTDIFIGPGVELPLTPGPFTVLIDSGGTGTTITRDNVKYLNLSVQIVVTATDYVDGEARANAICNALDGIFNSTVAA